MRESNPKSSAVLTRWVALPLVLAAVGCGSSNSDSQIGDFGVTAPNHAGAGPDLVLPPSGTGAGAGNATGGTGSVDPGAPYMLPPDFTAATLGGFKLGSEIDPGATGGAGAPASGGSTGCGTSILGVVRDFKGANEPGGHGDFEAFQGDSASKGIVAAMLGADQKPVYTAMGAFIDPHNGPQTTTKDAFDQWYRATPNVNKPFIIYFYFQPNGNVLTFQSAVPCGAFS